VLSVIVFAALFAIPLLPGLREVRRPRDDGRLEIPEGYTREPRYFGRAARASAALRLADAPAVPVRIGDGASAGGDVLGRSHVTVGDGARLADIYAGGDLTCGAGTTAGAACSDGDATFAPNCTIVRWVDAAGDLRAGRGCDLGISAAAGKTVALGADVRFGRVYGSPVTVAADAASDGSAAVDGARTIGTNDAPGDTIERGDVAVAPGALVTGNIKAYGSIVIGADARVTGNVVSRTDVILCDGAAVDGHVFAEDYARTGRRARVGTASLQKTAFAGRGIRLGGGTIVHGWIVCDGLGVTGS